MYTICKIKNLTGTVNTLHGHEFQVAEVYTIQEASRKSWATSDEVVCSITDEDYEVHDNEGAVSGVSSQLDWLKSYLPHSIDIESMTPFAEPLYRSKFTAIPSIVTVSINTSENIDYEVPIERYVYGGQIIVENAELGDYIEALIYDKDSVIPSEYRSALCEDWPKVATYIEKNFLPVNGDNIIIADINTYPLNAKITTGLYMRIVYHAVNVGSQRKVGVNYLMTKKL